MGQALLPLLQAAGQVMAVGRAECDLRDRAAIRTTVAKADPAVIVNAAAYTAVDKAESDPETCFAVNAEAPAVMACEAAARGIPLIHYSTDYVFNGENAEGYVETDATDPLNVYGASKLRGEEEIKQSGARFAVLRTSWVYSNYGHNFLKTMLRLGAERPELRVVSDQTGAPTSAGAIAAATARLLQAVEKMPSGIYHMTAAGRTSWFGFAEAIFRMAAEQQQTQQAGATSVPKLVPIETTEYPTPAQRPRYSVLRNDKFEHTFGFRLAPWEEQLAEVLGDGERSARPVQGD